ncbi:MAG: hypothetical protein FWD53_05240 [Phycisphaerales bacterium]|nr:hypothetical protein [Phycisphaerales bacterium]
MRIHRSSFALVLSLAVFTAAPLWADSAPALGALAKMPVKEVTVFKDGHALVLHSGKMPADAVTGNVTLDYLPAPVLGTFWSATNDKGAKLTAVTASQKRVAVARTALTLRELLEANEGQLVRLKMTPETTTQPGLEYVGRILSFPIRSVEELEAVSAPNTAPKLPQKSSLLLLKTDLGTRALDINRIQEVLLPNDHNKAATDEELRNLLTLKIQWENNKPLPQADISMMYLQKGIRWIPSYKVTIDGKGTATVQLQATIINELYDLHDVSAHLVVGVPTFAFADTTDPIALQQRLAPLSAHFAQDSRTRNSLSNSAVMSQTAGWAMGKREVPGEPTTPDLGPEAAGGTRNEDLFIFNFKNLTLKKGDRMVVPVSEFKIPYKDIYKLDLPFTPPPEVWRQFANQQQSEIARLAAAPKFMHMLRMTNKSDAPLTTAPALIVRDDRVLAQAIMTYTPIAGQVDLAITQAIDITVKKTDKETQRNPKAERWESYDIARIDLAGNIKITNHRHTKVDLEITRNLLGQVNTADNDGKVEMVNIFEDHTFAPAGMNNEYPHWWGWYSWPSWWSRFNGVGRINWKATLEPEKSLELNYTWYYYWR